MSEKFTCPHCGQLHRWKPEFAGKRAKCKCGNVITVPAGPEVPDVPAYESAGPDAAGACPACGAAMEDGATLCVSCGYDRETGQQILTAVSTPLVDGATPGVALASVRTQPGAAAQRDGGDLKKWKTALYLFGFAAVFVIAGLWTYYDLGEMEHSGGRRRVNSVLALAYRIGGRIGPLLVCLALAAVSAVAGILRVLGLWRDRGE